MDRRVALKVLLKAVALDTRAVTRFIREAQVAGKLSHPNIVHVHGMRIEERIPYFAMELVDGETLAQIVARLRAAEGKKDEEGKTLIQAVTQLFEKSGAAKEARAEGDTDRPAEAWEALPRSRTILDTAEVDLRYFANVAAAFAGAAAGLQHAHERGIIHRDLKPSNLILDSTGQLRILDFGLARLEGQESLTASGDLLGTVLYMSPEQAMARCIPIDRRTDLYSLGASIYEMLTWRPPFQGKSQQDTLSKIISQEPVPPRQLNPRIPKDLETIALKCLRKAPADRYGTAEALAQDLRRFVRGPFGLALRARLRAGPRRRPLRGARLLRA